MGNSQNSPYKYIIAIGTGLYIGSENGEQVTKENALCINLEMANFICNYLIKDNINASIEFA